MNETKVMQQAQPVSAQAVRWMATGVLAVAAVLAAVGAHAQGHREHGAEAPGMMMFGGPPEHIARMVDHLLDGLGVSDAQRSQIKQIAVAAASDLKAQRDAGRNLREQGVQILTAPSVDAGAAENLRQQMTAQQEQASKRTLQAMLDVARVLSPEQRAKIGTRLKERQAMMNDRAHRMQQERPPRGPRPPEPAPPK